MSETETKPSDSPPKSPSAQEPFDSLIPPQGFIPDFLSYARYITDASDRLLIPVAIALAGHALARNVYSLRGPMHLNTYQILVGPSGCGKTTAIDIGLDLLRAAMPGTLLADEFTTERMIGLFKQEPKQLWACPEFSLALEHMGRDYEKGLRPLLTHLYGVPEKYGRQLQSGGVELERPCLTLLLASQSDWWTSKLQEVDSLGGWLPRVAICPAGPKTREYPMQEAPDRTKRDGLIAQLKDLAEKRGQMNLTPGALTEWKDQMAFHGEVLQERANSEALRPFFKRLEDYGRKVSMIYTVTRTLAYEVEAEDILRAFDWITLIREATVDFVGGLAYGKDEKDLARVLRLIKDNSGITHTDLSQRAHVGMKDRLVKVLDTLADRGQIEQRTETPKAGGRPLRTYWPKGELEQT
jgi:hypothetical protein